MLKFLFISLAFLSVLSVIGQPAQSGTIISSSSYGLYFRGYNGGEIAFDNNGKSKIGNYDLESIKGQLYWNNEYQPAQLFLKGDKYLGEFKVRFEMLNMVFYIQNNDQLEVKVIDPAYIEKVKFINNFNGFQHPVFVNTFYSLSAKTKGVPNTYMQELLTGPVSIYKKNKVLIRYQDSLFGSIKKPFLIDQTSYYIFYKGDFREIKKLSYKNIQHAFPFLQSYLLELDQKKINWSNEKDVILLIENLNAILKKMED